MGLIKDLDILFSGNQSERESRFGVKPPTPAVEDQSSDDSDCVGCKAVTVLTSVGLSSYLVYRAYHNPAGYTGRKRAGLVGMAASLSSALLLLAYCRVTDTGPYDRNNKDKTLMEITKSDLSKLYHKFGKEPPKILSPDKK